MFEQTLAAKAQNSPESFGPAFQNYQKLKVGIDNLVSLVDTDKAALNKLSGNKYVRCYNNWILYTEPYPLTDIPNYADII